MKGQIKYQLILEEYINKLEYLAPVTNKDFYAYTVSRTNETQEEVKTPVNMALSRLVKNREDFFRLQNGIYYRAKKTIFGYAKIDSLAVLRKKYITNNGDDQIIGYETGLSLLNKSGLTTQVPAYTFIATNKHKGRGLIKVENLNAYLAKPLTTVNSENYLYLQALELVSALIKSKDYILVNNPHKTIYHYIMNLGLDAARLMYYAGMCNVGLAGELVEVFYQGRLNDTPS